MACASCEGIKYVNKFGSDSLTNSNDAYLNTLLRDVENIENRFEKYIPCKFLREALYSGMTDWERYHFTSDWRNATQANYMNRRAGSDSKQPESPAFLRQMICGDKTYIIDGWTNEVRDIIHSNGPGKGISFLGLISDIQHIYGRGELFEAVKDNLNGVELDGR